VSCPEAPACLPRICLLPRALRPGSLWSAHHRRKTAHGDRGEEQLREMGFACSASATMRSLVRLEFGREDLRKAMNRKWPRAWQLPSRASATPSSPWI